jgi:energy-coupling factor transporter ATP-binding protein EcfA2
MRLRTLDYAEYQVTPREWSLNGLMLGQVNLVVGKNASGKSRTLNVINGLGRLLSGAQKPAAMSSGSYKILFDHEGRLLRYNIDIQDRKVLHEEFIDGETVRLTRGEGGSGRIYHVKEDQDFDFQTPESDAAAVARLDKIQHGFLAPLAEWAEGVRHYEFGSYMGRTHLAVIVTPPPDPDPRDANAIIGLFRRGVKLFPNVFAETVKRDMSAIGYEIDDIGTMAPTDIALQIPLGSNIEPMILYVKERDLAGVTQQPYISQGMFRALAVIIHMAYATLASRPSCIIVDDIGEGIDFDRSCKLIKLIRDRAKQADIQLILSTNDKFVMNEVPIEEWSILQRTGGHVWVRNHANAKDAFDNFQYVGMSNFTFFEMDFVNGRPQMEAATAHE